MMNSNTASSSTANPDAAGSPDPPAPRRSSKRPKCIFSLPAASSSSFRVLFLPVFRVVYEYPVMILSLLFVGVDLFPLLRFVILCLDLFYLALLLSSLLDPFSWSRYLASSTWFGKFYCLNHGFIRCTRLWHKSAFMLISDL